MAIFQVHTIELMPNGAHRYVNFKTDHSDLDALTDDLRKGPVVGHQLHAYRSGDEMLITDSNPLMLTAAYVVMIRPASLPFVSASSEAA